MITVNNVNVAVKERMNDEGRERCWVFKILGHLSCLLVEETVGGRESQTGVTGFESLYFGREKLKRASSCMREADSASCNQHLYIFSGIMSVGRVLPSGGESVDGWC
jgi:hypothetical protein